MPGGGDDSGAGDDSFPRSLDDPYYPVGVIAGIREGEANDDIIPGADDGLVSIESTRLAHMTDFVVIETGHTMMRYSEAVATQTIHFLRHGRFQGSISN